MLGVGIPGGYSRVAATRVIIQSCISNRESMPNHCVCSDTGGVPGEPSYTPKPSRPDRGGVSPVPYLNLSVRDLLYQTGAGSRRLGYPIGFLIAATVLRASDVAPGCARARADAVRGAVRGRGPERREISAGRMRDGV